mgnify:CR=1 FL=1
MKWSLKNYHVYYKISAQTVVYRIYVYKQANYKINTEKANTIKSVSKLVTDMHINLETGAIKP